MLDPTLMDLLVCPKSKQPLEQIDDELVCKASGLAYPIVDGIPVLLAEEAREI